MSVTRRKRGKPVVAFSGAVFAGGHSRRMGRDKALLRRGGEPMWRRQVRVLEAAGANPVVILRRADQSVLGRREAQPIRNVRDQFVDAGPLAGLHAALVATDAPLVAMLAVDMPAIDAAWFSWLRGSCSPEAGAVVRHADGFEPLAAIYPRAALPMVTRRLRARACALQALVNALIRAGQMNVVILPEAERWRVMNWNYPRRRATASLTRRRG